MNNTIPDEVVSRYCEYFNAIDEELYKGDIDNAGALDFMLANVPRFQCPDPMFEEIWYFRWWSFRKHIRSTRYGRILLEFMPDVPWAGPCNAINCPATHQLREARWLKDKGIAEEYMKFWMHPDNAEAARSYTFAAAYTALEVAKVTGNTSMPLELYKPLAENHEQWKKRNQRTNGMFYQIDDRDGMECSIGGNGYRCTINSAMYAEATALSQIAAMAGNEASAANYAREATNLRRAIEGRLWNPDAQFFMTRTEQQEAFVGVRELHGYTPWYYLPHLHEKFDVAWAQLNDSEGFRAPFGPTTAERRHPKFQISRTGHHCKWDGPSWPFATSVTLTALANLLQERPSTAIGKRDYFELLATYAKSHYIRTDKGMQPWLDENLDPFTGEWLARSLIIENKEKQARERGKDYLHSTFADLIITGLCGISVNVTGEISAKPLLPPECWSHFTLENLYIQGHYVTLRYDRDGSNYHGQPGFSLFIDGISQM